MAPIIAKFHAEVRGHLRKKSGRPSWPPKGVATDDANKRRGPSSWDPQDDRGKAAGKWHTTVTTLNSDNHMACLLSFALSCTLLRNNARGKSARRNAHSRFGSWYQLGRNRFLLTRSNAAEPVKIKANSGVVIWFRAATIYCAIAAEFEDCRSANRMRRSSSRNSRKTLRSQRCSSSCTAVGTLNVGRQPRIRQGERRLIDIFVIGPAPRSAAAPPARRCRRERISRDMRAARGFRCAPAPASLREAAVQIAIGLDRGAVGRHHVEHRRRHGAAARLLGEADLGGHCEKNALKDAAPRSTTLLMPSSAIRRSNSAISPLTSPIARPRSPARQILAPACLRRVEVEGGDRVAFVQWKSVSRRASSVLPTRGRGEATMVTELRNDIADLDPSS